MIDLASSAQDTATERHAARRAALACMITLAVVLGIGRFAFTPLLPLMLHGGALGQPQIDIQHGGWLASANYAGYFVGAITCAALRVAPARMVRAGLVATVLLTLAMGVTSQFWVWAVVRFIAGAVSAWTFVFASQWGLRRLAELGAHGWGGVIYTGPGMGIVGTGLLVSAAGGYGATVGWIGFGLIAAVLSIVVWPVFGAVTGTTSKGATLATNGSMPVAHASQRSAGQHSAGQHDTGQYVAIQRPTNHFSVANQIPAAGQHAPTNRAPHRADAFWLILLYGVPGFGYIITATFLPVIARHALPGSSWPDLFWPMFGAALIVGALLAARLPVHWDNRTLLAGCYVLQAAGIALGIVWPTAGGFSLGSILIGLPFTAITLFAMREARRLLGDEAAGLMGYATAAYGVGQIVGPLVAAPIAEHTGSFSPALWLAAGTLLLGAAGLIVVAHMPRGRGRMPDCGCN
ncbi:MULTISPECIES: YbfB/YjiJ family MFS transporter [Paraburkholderia]|uniref:YbfB/YjiJ family MFS transporter n=1 Tax=Paraburkholderia TaxID=1822464 RepID=UPI00155863C2|nr:MULTISPECIES: YbfB/YjiJ family MFS transporter [Paraburkholderia]MCX4173384.1 YbfB/YjiJ family MFS transporter [Paraburkholderia madseniana]MDQ6461389.1 YbfB/YjiJ family MFS transporter [Paraburkholderia madseniana]NPT67349.1 YbfB/YjiJ family MFS transporter [Paraburkholderia madseniana]